tara:strand:+ start:619 stop:1023 length:405 start_codon:yes stop_codon:yes gene_type:complete
MEEKEVMDQYMEYIRAFESKDFQTIAKFCRTPFFASSPAGTTVFNDKEELINGFSMLRNSLDEENYVGSRLNLLEFSSVAETTGTLFVDFDRMNPEGEAYFNGQALYIFQRGNDGTEIIGIAVLDDNTVSSWTD